VAKRLIEVFTAACSVCEGAVEQVKAFACDNCEEAVYNFSLSVNNKLTIPNGGGGNVHVQVI
jgi:hypothetical protein